jgi:hypothetical protein
VAQGSPGSHLAVVTGEFGGNQFGVIQLPTTAGSGTSPYSCPADPAISGAPSVCDHVSVFLPNTPDGNYWSEGLDPHTVTAYVSPNSGKAFAVMANLPPPTYLAVVDMAALLAAPRLSGEGYSQSPAGPGTYSYVDQAGLEGCVGCIDLVASGILRYVATRCGETGAPC